MKKKCIVLLKFKMFIEDIKQENISKINVTFFLVLLYNKIYKIVKIYLSPTLKARNNVFRELLKSETSVIKKLEIVVGVKF